MSQYSAVNNIPQLKSTDPNEIKRYVNSIANIVAMMSKELDHIINGNIGANNLKENSIDAKALGIKKLSEITNDLGTIAHGNLSGVRITTRSSGYPRVIWNETGDIVAIEYSATRRILFDPVGITGSLFPAIRFISDSNEARLVYKGSSGMELNTELGVNRLKVAQQQDIQIGATNLKTILDTINQRLDDLEA